MSSEPDAKRPRALQEKQYITYTLVKYKELDCTSLQAYLASRHIKEIGEWSISMAKRISKEFADIKILSTTIDEIVESYFDEDEDDDEDFRDFMNNKEERPTSKLRYGELKRIVALIHEFADTHKDYFRGKLKDQEALYDVIGEIDKTDMFVGLWTIERSCRQACAKTGDMYWHELGDTLVRAVYDLKALEKTE